MRHRAPTTGRPAARAWRWLAASVASYVAACGDVGCLDDDPACVVPSPCQTLGAGCDEGTTSVRVLEAGDALPTGPRALASPGDFVLSNDRVVAVVDALDHPHYLAPSGGALLDLASRDSGRDALNHVFQAAGLLPGDAARYTEARLLEGDGFAALQLRGHLDGDPDHRIATRYEIRPCEPGVRVRTELVNGSPDPMVWMLADGFYWGGKSHLPFAPGRGGGFDHPELDIEHATDAFRSFPFVAALPPGGDSAAYVCTPCGTEMLSGFHDEDISAIGHAPRIVPPRDHAILERFIGVVDADSIGPAVDLALKLRERAFREAWVTLNGRVSEDVLGALGSEALATVRVSEANAGTPAAERIPRTQVTPDASGVFAVRVPAERDYLVEVDRFGRSVLSREVRVGEHDEDLGTLALSAPAELGVDVTLDGAPADAVLIVEPADARTRDDVEADRFGKLATCAPMLGPPDAGSPACNRVLVSGSVTFFAPPGRYRVYATAGPFATLGRVEVELAPGDRARLALALASLPLRPAGALAADFHVHGAASFDSSLPDLDRVRSFLAARLDVLVASDHDVVHDYADAIEALDAGQRIVVVPGVETTGHVLFDYVPGADVPKVVGHWNFWPLNPDPLGPYRGAAWDELAEPGLLMTRMEDEAGWSHADGVVQLNHPWEEDDFGRDQAFPRAIDLDLERPFPPDFDGTSQSLFHREPPGARHRNSDYDVQEVMNGTENRRWLEYRRLWFELLDRGIVRAGTANSDSHGLADSTVGSPRTLVWSDATLDAFDLDAFNAAVREGRMIGTNGPVVEAEIVDGSESAGPSTHARRPGPAAELRVRVRAAPWVPVDEVRLIVDGRVVRTLRDELSHPSDPFGSGDLDRLEATFALDELLAVPDRDAWIVVEAGAPLDAEPMTADGPTPSDDLFSIAVSGARPAAFTNPFLIDPDGNGFVGVED